ncbi:MAG: YARHG domain-containing protein [Candidatus Limiplasma sp.]|nr:YARHG domain-containing protein [Candidatus Limiplasma sp.]MEA5145694.1 YARHG domain-containing protein [Candidatus Limiplasma sp.]
MQKRLLALMLALLLLPAGALASRLYIIPDSDTRKLTETELWGWDYESLGYILNEIFARHGYNFHPGEKYDNFFSSMPWYTPNSNPDNTVACYPQLTSVEWFNERLVKDVRAQMRAQGTSNPHGKHYLDEVRPDTFDVLSGFTLTRLKAGQKLSVYAAPSRHAYRGANGKAMVNTNGSVYVAGWESGWLLVMYETNSGAVRVGYVEASAIKGAVDARTLIFADQPVTLAADATLTDDPATRSSTLCRLNAGETVTYLTTYQNSQAWAYVQTTIDGVLMRGFVPADALGLDSAEEENK